MVDRLRQYGSSKMYADRVKVKINNAVSSFDIARLRAYTLYEDFYTNLPDSFKVIMRGDDEAQQQIYVPSSEQIIEAICRYHAIDPEFEIEKKDDTALKTLVEDLWEREAFAQKHTQNKRWGCVRGDSAFFITVDENKTAGERISITDLDPSNYFPIENPMNTTQVLGFHIVDEVPHPNRKKNETAVRRQTYMREGRYDPNDISRYIFTGRIVYSSAIFTTGKWDSRTLNDREIEKIMDIKPPVYLKEGIKSLPVYWIPNRPLPGSNYGRSEIAGVETLVAAINQTMSDEDITLAMKGLGVYVTDADSPKDAANKVTDWEVGPGRVLEIQQGRKFENVSGVATVEPMQDHINAAQAMLQAGKGVPDIAVGKIDVQTAESGISLRLQMGPILSTGKEKESNRAAIENQMFYDLVHQWFPTYEGYSPVEGQRLRIKYGDPLPKDYGDIFDKHVAVYELGIYPFAKFSAALNAMGFEFDLSKEDFEAALEEQKKLAAAQNFDPFAEQMAKEKADLEREQFEHEKDNPPPAPVVAPLANNGKVTAK